MSAFARAPGKLVVLGEYAVLEGAEALVMAVDRNALASVEASGRGICELTTLAPERVKVEFSPDGKSGVALVDIVLERFQGPAAGAPWSATVDTRAFFQGSKKLGLGSSAAALCAFAGAWSSYAAAGGEPRGLAIVDLIELHRRFQGGAGSGLDVAASVTGGLISYRLEGDGVPRIGSVRLPNSVAFAGVFAGASASTPDYVGRFRAWQAANAAKSARKLERMSALAAAGCEAARAAEIDVFFAHVSEYGAELEDLGRLIGREIVTAEHREIRRLAEEHGVAYKVSGAGGGDLGIATSCDIEAMERLREAVRARGYEWIDLTLDCEGLVVEERM